MDQKKTTVIRLAASVASGWLALLLAQFPLVIDSIYSVSIYWSLILPLMISWAWGAEYAAIACTLGGVCAIPFIQTPEFGMGNILISSFCVVAIMMTGGFFSEKQKRRRMTFYIGMILYSVICYAMINSMLPNILIHNATEYKRYISPMILSTYSMGFILSIFVLLCAVKVLFCLPVVRKVFGIEKLPYSGKNLQVMCAVFGIAAAYALIDQLVDNAYFNGRGIHTSIFYHSSGSPIKILMAITAALLICDFVLFDTMRSMRSGTELQISEERYRTIYSNMIDTYLEIDRSGRILRVTPSVSDTLGHSEDFVTGKQFSSFFDDNAAADIYTARLFESGRLLNIELTGKEAPCPDLLVSGKTMYRTELGGNVGAITIRNITDYKKTEAKRRELSAMTNAIFESNRDLIWVVDGSDFTLTYFNRAFSEYILRTRGIKAARGSTISELFTESEAEFFEQSYCTVLQKGNFFSELRTEKEQLSLDLSFYPIRVSRNVVNISVFAKDMTKQVNAEQEILRLNEGLEKMVDERTIELKDAYRDLESYSYTVTHEFKTPVREIDAYMSIIEEDNADILPEQSVKDLHSVRRICSEALDMIQKMMVYSKAGYMVLNIEDIDMEKMVREVVEEVSMSHSIPCELTCYELPHISADKFLMRVAVTNIISNSIKFSKKHGKAEITVGCMISSGTKTYYFTDKGVGFTPNEKNDLFALYNRAHNSGDYDGSGIGLAVVQRICRRSAGEAYIFGKEGVGCTVVLEFRGRGEQT